MEKIPKGSPEYKLIEKEYISLIENITREKNYTKFIGGLPVTLERKDIFTILSKDNLGNYRYSATQKVDGMRLLLFANYKKANGLRNITFIDRNNDFYTLKNRNRNELPDFKGPKLLIDGELVTYSNENEVISANEKYFNIKMFSFMAFDILYGPINIEYSGPPREKTLNIGSEGAMAGPLGGKIWSYQKRYDLLYQLIVPNEFNNFSPVLSLAFKECSWLVQEIKPIYFMSSLKTGKKLYESGNRNAFFQHGLIEFRKQLYTLINEFVRTENKYHAELINVKLDGLIFTPFDAEYITGGPWKKFLNTQYKWKPVEEQSIDFAIFRQSNQSSNYVLKVKKGAELTVFTQRKTEQIEAEKSQKSQYVPAKVSSASEKELSRSKIRDGTIGEFTYNTRTKEFELRNLRRDKDSPNALSTAINVMNAIKNPVDLEVIKQFFLINKLNKNGMKNLLEYMSKSQMLRCMINNDKFQLFNQDTKEYLSKLLTEYKTNNAYEFEIRFGIIEPQRFQTNLPFNLYKQFIDIISKIYTTIKPEYSVFYDMYSGDIRTRYLYNENLSSMTNIGSIQKQTIENVNLDLKYLYNLDVRFGLSNEKSVTENVTKENANLVLEKKRFSFSFDNGNFSLDCTEISKMVNEIREAPKFQIELELKNNSLPNEEIINKISEILRNVLGQINS
jgi:hypothetical protein